MLVWTRRLGKATVIGDDIPITVTLVRGDTGATRYYGSRERSRRPSRNL
jgi:hypothetical protein